MPNLSYMKIHIILVCSFLINMFILNIVYKFQVSNLWLLILSLATIGIMKGKEGEIAIGKKILSVFVTTQWLKRFFLLFLVFQSSVELFEVWDDWLHFLVGHNSIFFFFFLGQINWGLLETREGGDWICDLGFKANL